MHCNPAGSSSPHREVSSWFIDRDFADAAAADRWIDSSSSFSYHAASQIFHQSASAADMLDVMLKVNQDKLSGIILSKSVQTDDGHSFAAGTTLVQIAQRGLKAGASPVGALNAVMNALAAQTKCDLLLLDRVPYTDQTRTPVLWAIDDVQSLFQTSQYRKPDYTFIESYHLSTPSLALSFLTGASGFVRFSSFSDILLTLPERQTVWFYPPCHTPPLIYRHHQPFLPDSNSPPPGRYHRTSL